MKREFDRKIWKSGNSYVVTIPSETVERFNLENKFVTVSIVDDQDKDNSKNKDDKVHEKKHYIG